MSDAAVIIPTHNRVEMLLELLHAVQSQNIPLEVYVMDDASTDGTEARVRGEFPQVNYHREEQSKGPTFQRNKAAAMTKAEFIFTIDDDLLPVSPDTFARTLEGFDHPRVAAVTIPYMNVKQDRIIRHHAANPRGEVEAVYDYFGGMVAFRRDVFLGVGGYRSYLFMHVEEGDLAARILNAGYVIRLGWAEPMHHLESPLRYSSRLEILGARNHLLYSFYNVPWPYFPFHLTGTALNSLRPSGRKGHFFRAMRGIGRGIGGMFHEWRQRKPISRNAYLLTRKLRVAKSLPLSGIEPLLPPIQEFQNVSAN
jgi:glycosyltransferase involved in cell wall biosynthesis